MDRDAPVTVTLKLQTVEVSFGPGFTAVDVASIKAIPGRRWRPRRRVWILPRSPEVVRGLEQRFGERIVERVGWAQSIEPERDPDRGDAPAPTEESEGPPQDLARRIHEALILRDA